MSRYPDVSVFPQFDFFCFDLYFDGGVSQGSSWRPGKNRLCSVLVGNYNILRARSAHPNFYNLVLSRLCTSGVIMGYRKYFFSFLTVAKSVILYHCVKQCSYNAHAALTVRSADCLMVVAAINSCQSHVLISVHVCTRESLFLLSQALSVSTP